jgi:hypothetical protein
MVQRHTRNDTEPRVSTPKKKKQADALFFFVFWLLCPSNVDDGAIPHRYAVEEEITQARFSTCHGHLGVYREKCSNNLVYAYLYK